MIPKTVEVGGVSFQSSVNSITNVINVSFALSGLSSTAAIGVVDPADQIMGLTGQESTVAQGTAVAPNEDVSPTGLAITSSQGTAAGVTSHEADLTGFAVNNWSRFCCSSKRCSYYYQD